jgi:hypothetical protein
MRSKEATAMDGRCADRCVLCAVQLLTKAGLLNVPEWYEAGKVSIETCGIPFGEW